MLLSLGLNLYPCEPPRVRIQKRPPVASARPDRRRALPHKRAAPRITSVCPATTPYGYTYDGVTICKRYSLDYQRDESIRPVAVKWRCLDREKPPENPLIAASPQKCKNMVREIYVPPEL